MSEQGIPIIVNNIVDGTVRQGHPVNIMGYIDENGILQPGLPTTGGGGGGTLLVATVADLDNVESPTEGQLVAVEETGTLWKYQAGAWIDTGTAFGNFFGGGYAEASIDVTRQYTKTNQELIELFGVFSENTITVDQSAVNYGVLGTYDVIFTFSKGKGFTLKLNVVKLFNFDVQDTKKYATKTTDLQGLFGKLGSAINLTNSNFILNGAPPASNPTPTRYEWNGVNVELLKNIQVEFNNALTLSDGTAVKLVINSIRESIYGVPELTNQAVGFDFTGGNFKIIFKNFNELTFKATFRNQTTNEAIEFQQINALFSNIQAAKIAGTDYLEARVYVKDNTLLLGDEKTHPATEIPVTLFSYEPYSLALETDERVKMLLSKSDDSSILFTIGKEYTGLRTNPFTGLSWEEIGISFSVGTQVGESAKYIYAENNTAIPVTVGGFSTLVAIPEAQLNKSAKYRIRVSANYIRPSGGTTPSFVGFRAFQGIEPPVIDGSVSIVRESTEPLAFNFPQLVKYYEFKDAGSLVVQAYVEAGGIACSIQDFKVILEEV